MSGQAFDKNLKSTIKLIKESKNIIIACHMNPDGDALGSLLGLGFALKRMGKKVTLLCPDKVPLRYSRLLGAKTIKQTCHEGADLAISVDCGSIAQLSRLESAFRKSKRIIEIDHHKYRTRFGDVQLINRHVCSVGEIIFLLLKKMRVKIDKKIAENLLTSLLVETSSFSRPDVKNSTFNICSALMQTGIDFAKISDLYYWRKKLSVFHLCGICFARIKMRANNQVAWSIVYKKDFEEQKGSKEDVDAVPDDMLMIEGVRITLLFRELEDNMLRVSLRSRGRIDIGYLASLYGGGGHHDVAGCRIHNTKATVEKFIDQACELLHKRHHEKIV